MKMRASVLVGLLLVLAVGGHAVDVSDRVAVGYNAGVGGISARFFTGDELGIEVAFAAGSEFWNPTGTLLLDAAMAASVRVLLVVDSSDRANLMLFVEAGGAINDITEDPAIAATLDLSLAVGLTPELFLTDRLSLQTDLGVAFTMEDVGQPIYAIGIAGIGAPVNLVGGLSFHWYLS